MSRVSIRYAKALFSLAQDENNLDTLAVDLGKIEDVLNTNEDFDNFTANPLVSAHKKTEVVKALFENKINTLTLTFLYLLCTKKRLNLLREILLRFNDLLLKQRNQVHADLVSAKQLDDQQVDIIKTNIESLTQKSVVLKTKEDVSLIGGFKIKIEDIIIDNSIRNQLGKLREKLIA